MIGQQNYTVILTYGNLIFGVIGMFLSLQGNIAGGVTLLVIAGICDMFDGAVANTKKNRSEAEMAYGIQIDSLADLISFCCLPAIMGYSLGNESFIAILIYVFFILAGLIRLSHYNVTEMSRKDKQREPRTYYEGLPVTSVACILPLLFILSNVLNLDLASIYTYILGIIGLLFITKVKIKKINVAKLFKIQEKKQEKNI